jgi:hypothetical protein
MKFNIRLHITSTSNPSKPIGTRLSQFAAMIYYRRTLFVYGPKLTAVHIIKERQKA